MLNINKLKKSRIRGFTLIELMVVMTIIAVLAVLITSAISIARRTSRDTQRRSNMKIIQTYLESYFTKQKYYPPNSSPAWQCDGVGINRLDRLTDNGVFYDLIIGASSSLEDADGTSLVWNWNTSGIPASGDNVGYNRYAYRCFNGNSSGGSGYQLFLLTEAASSTAYGVYGATGWVAQGKGEVFEVRP